MSSLLTDYERFEELERQADAELGPIEQLTPQVEAIAAEALRGEKPALRVACIARKAEHAYVLRGVPVPQHVACALSGAESCLEQVQDQR